MPTAAEIDRLAKDTGCKYYSDCLTCPRLCCIYDEKNVHSAIELRREKIRSMLPARSMQEIAAELGVHVRTVQRALKEI